MNPQHIPLISTINNTPPNINLTQKHRSTFDKHIHDHAKMNIADFKVINHNGYLNQVKYKKEYVSNYKLRDDKVFENRRDSNSPSGIKVSYIIPNVPLNLMPPPPHNAVNNNNNIMSSNFNRRGNWKSGVDIRCNSPQGSESDESCRSYKSRESPLNYGSNQRIIRNVNAQFSENSLVYNKFSNSSPSVFYQPLTNSHNNGHFKPRYYTNSSSQRQRRETKKQPISDINKRVHGLMERFTSRSILFRIPANPSYLLVGNEWDKLNQSIWDIYLLKGQKEATYIHKLELWKMVYLAMKKSLFRYGLFLVGSTMSGLGLESSDIDMCLLVRPCLTDPRSDALHFLQNISRLLEDCDFAKSPVVIMAKVPILKFRDTQYGFEVDLNCNNSVGIRNTHLLHCYAHLDWRVRPLVAIVKMWAQTNDINDAKTQTISSYSLALMVIHYLQCGVSPPAIPCLQGMYQQKFSPNVEIHDIDIQEELPPFYSDNKQSLGELFQGFLLYYTCFDYNLYAISVREAAVLLKEDCRFTRAPKNDATQWKLLAIEEPFDLTNTARSVYDNDTFEHIKNVFRISHETLFQTKNLSSILPNGSQR